VVACRTGATATRVENVGVGFGRYVESGPIPFYVSWHGDVDCVMGVIPCQCHPEVEQSAPVGVTT
jgi:hypothetical protein